MSVLCATATSIDQMIVYRALQGFIGGGMIPTVFAAAFTIFPRSRQAMVSPMIGLVATLAPTIGPTVGGYLTDLFSWHWLFLVNVVPGIVVTVAAWLLIDFDKPDSALLEELRLVGPAVMAVFLGASNTCSRRARATTGSRTTRDPAARRSLGTSAASLFFWRAFTREGADRRPARLHRPQFRRRLRCSSFVHGHRPLRPDLSLPGLSRAGPRLLTR